MRLNIYLIYIFNQVIYYFILNCLFEGNLLLKLKGVQEVKSKYLNLPVLRF